MPTPNKKYSCEAQPGLWTPEVLSYMAALVERGSFNIERKKYPDSKNCSYRILISISSTHFDLIKWIATHFGGKFQDPRIKRSNNNYRGYIWQPHSRDTWIIAWAIYPYLKAKKNIGTLILEFIDLTKISLSSLPYKYRKDCIKKREDTYIRYKEAMKKTNYWNLNSVSELINFTATQKEILNNINENIFNSFDESFSIEEEQPMGIFDELIPKKQKRQNIRQLFGTFNLWDKNE